jgi:DNA repair exonuclease SbcCD ATPase subunit
MIVFEKLTFSNFLSSGDRPVSINLNSEKTVLIHGTNGSGKSTILDALCYVLFSKPFRSINLPQLINTQNRRGLLTEVEFSIGKSSFLVRRGMKPKVFEVYKDGEIIDAKAADKDNQKYLESNILKMNHRTFTQVVILGSSNFVPFMQLNSIGRKECIEDFLDIKIFSSMSLLAKERLKGLKDYMNNLRGDISNLEYKIDVQTERVEELEERSASDIDLLQKELLVTENLIAEQKKLIDKYQESDRDLVDQISVMNKNYPKKTRDEYNKIIIKLDNKVDRLTKDIEFYQSNDTCPTCSQSLDEQVKHKKISHNITESNKVLGAKDQAKTKFDELEVTLSLIQNKEYQINEIHQHVIQCETKIDSLHKNLLEKKDRLSNIKDNSSLVDREKGKLEILNENLVDLKSKRDEVVGKVSEHDIVVNLLKESGVKTQIVKKYLPVMNKFISKYLNDLEFPIFFTLDEEFNEVVQSPFHQNFSYASFSEGQKARIDLSLMLTWREIGKLKNSVSTNLLILDEVFSSSLDDTGKENLFKLLKYGLDDKQKVVVIDHTLSQNFKEKFDNSIEVSMVKGFSSYD